MKYLLMIVLLCTINQARASEAFMSGNYLLERCEAYINKTNTAKGHVCLGYVGGIADIHEIFVNWGDMKANWCLPVDGNVNMEQLLRIVTKNLQENPENLHLSASSLISNNFAKTFPCEKVDT